MSEEQLAQLENLSFRLFLLAEEIHTLSVVDPPDFFRIRAQATQLNKTLKDLARCINATTK